jgi:large subunit ribosomal protein L22
MDVHASLRHLHQSPRKVRLVVNAVRGLPVSEAVTRLTFLPKLAAKPVLKLVLSAMANAEHNFKLDKNELYIRHIVADGGPTVKRSRPRAFGRAAPIRKRTTHITLILATRDTPHATSPKKVKRVAKSVKREKATTK